MDIGFIGLGRMGLNMSIRLRRAQHRVAGFNQDAEKLVEARTHGIETATSVADLVKLLPAPRAVWMMIPAGKPVDDTLDLLVPLLASGDVVVDGGNSNYKDSRRRHERLAQQGLEFVDCGTSGGIWGLELGYCMMLGGSDAAIARLAPVLTSLAPKDGWLHVGGPGAGHYSKMIHNGIEYGMMQAYAEGFEILKASDYPYDLSKLAHLWNQGSVVRSWLLELAERAFAKDPQLSQIRGWVEDSGEGRWTVQAALEEAVPAEVLTAALYARFRSRQEHTFADKLLSALRREFGGHGEALPAERERS